MGRAYLASRKPCIWAPKARTVCVMPMKHLIWALGRWNRRIGRSGPSQATWQLEASLGYVGDRRICPTRLHVSFFSYFLKSSPSPVTSSPLGHLSACTLIGFHDTSESLLSSGSKPQNEVDGNRILLVEYWWTRKVSHRKCTILHAQQQHASILSQCTCKHSPIQ